MPLYKKYKGQRTFVTDYPRTPGIKDTTISNMMGYGGNGSINMDHKDYGKIKSKGGVAKNKTVVNNYTSKTKSNKKKQKTYIMKKKMKMKNGSGISKTNSVMNTTKQKTKGGISKVTAASVRNTNKYKKGGSC